MLHTGPLTNCKIRRSGGDKNPQCEDVQRNIVASALNFLIPFDYLLSRKAVDQLYVLCSKKRVVRPIHIRV